MKKGAHKIVPDTKDGLRAFVKENAATAEEVEEGELALDIFQTPEQIVVVAPIAGVNMEDITLTVTGEVLTIKGKRAFEFETAAQDYYTQECYWGAFSRSIILPESVDAHSITASYKNGILTVRIPKIEKTTMRVVHINEQ